MTETTAKPTKKLSLQQYVICILSKTSVSQFTTSIITEIIERELNVRFDPCHHKVLAEALLYYIENWPEWKDSKKIKYWNVMCFKLMEYLKAKFLFLSELESGAIKHLELPSNLNERLDYDEQQPNRKCQAPYVLQINIPEQLWCKNDLSFSKFLDNNLLLELKQQPKLDKAFDLEDLINYPFICTELKIPGLINITRCTAHKLDRFIHSNDVFPEVDKSFIISVEKGPPTRKIYTYMFFKEFFTKLKQVMMEIYANKPTLTSKKVFEISAFCDSFLEDIYESNLCDMTVCEGAKVDFNIGKNIYYFDKPIKLDPLSSSKYLVYRQILTPIISYSLVSCNILQEDVSSEGFRFFNNADEHFLYNVFRLHLQFCLSYKCTLCNQSFNIEDLKKHMRVVHPLELYMQCVKCSNCFPTFELMRNRWRHLCFNPVKRKNK